MAFSLRNSGRLPSGGFGIAGLSQRRQICFDQTSRSTANGKHDNTKSAGSSERASVKAEGTAEHATRSVAHEKTDMAQHPTHANETGHMSGMRESGMHQGGMGGTHGGLLGRMGGMHGGGLGGVGGLLLGGLSRL